MGPHTVRVRATAVWPVLCALGLVCVAAPATWASPAEDAAREALSAAQQAASLPLGALQRAELAKLAALWAVAAQVEYFAQPQPDEAAWPLVHGATEAASSVVGPLRLVEGVPYVRQSNDNLCATACAQMALRYLGHQATEDQLLGILGRDAASLGVHVSRLRDIASAYGVHALVGEGSEALVRCAITVGYPVLVYQYASPTNMLEHMRVIIGFDDTAQVYYAMDPSHDFGPNAPIPYSRFATLWSLPWREDGRTQWLCILYRRPEAPQP